MSASASVNKKGVSADANAVVGWGGGGSQGGVRFVNPDFSMIGLCLRVDTINSDGTITTGTPLLVTGASIPLPAPPAGKFTMDQYYSWGQGSGLTIIGPAFASVPSAWISRRIQIRPLLPNGVSGEENTTIDMTIRAAGPTMGSDRGLLVRNRVENLLLGGTPDLLPPWAEDVTFSSWRRVTSGPHAGGIHVTVGALGSEARTFRLDVNGTIGYADLSTAEVNTRGQWVLMEVDINRADIHEPQNLHEWATNDLHLEYSTDRTSLTLEDHSLTYRITAY